MEDLFEQSMCLETIGSIAVSNSCNNATVTIPKKTAISRQLDDDEEDD